MFQTNLVYSNAKNVEENNVVALNSIKTLPFTSLQELVKIASYYFVEEKTSLIF